MIFYAWGEPKYIFLMLLTILIVYIFGILIDKFDKENKKILKKIKKDLTTTTSCSIIKLLQNVVDNIIKI